MKLKIYKNLGVVDDNGRLIFFIPDPGPAAINEYEAPSEFDERIAIAKEIVDKFNKGESKC